MRRDEIVALQTGSRESLIEAWIETMGQPPPARLSRGMMTKLLMVERQWETSGQSRAVMVRRFEQVIASSQQRPEPAGQGTRLVREWKGRQHVVDVVPDGYTWNGKTYRSLSAIAKQITGVKWSGPRFFGVSP